MKIPEKLLARLQLLGLDQTIYDNRVRKCILSKTKMNLETVPWYSHAYYIPEKFDNKNDYFVFDPVSIVPCLALNPQKNEKILDMCAAPGSKTFILSFLANNEARIVSNDIDRFRVRRLSHNVNKFHLSAEVRNLSGRKITEKYDKILLDAPCSGEGMVNKNRKLFKNWSDRRIKILSKKQKKLAEHAFTLLENGGVMVYSTCTFGPEENEAVIDHLLNKFNNAFVEDVDVRNIRYDSGVTEWNAKKFHDDVKKCIRIYPQHNNTGGFFVARVKKEDLNP